MDIKILTDAAREASLLAHAPYSCFRVGAAVLLADGMIVKGNNQENMAYPLGSCAERVAVNYARANYPTCKIEAIAIFSPDSAEPITPCGGCREVLLEVVRSQNSDIIVIMAGQDTMQETMATELLPLSFKFQTHL